MIRSGLLPFHQPLIDENDERRVLEVLRSGPVTASPRPKPFERTLAAYAGAAIAVEAV